MTGKSVLVLSWGPEGTPGHILTDVHGGLAPEKQLQTLRFTIQTAVVEHRVPLGRLLIQVPTEEIKWLGKECTP